MDVRLPSSACPRFPELQSCLVGGQARPPASVFPTLFKAIHPQQSPHGRASYRQKVPETSMDVSSWGLCSRVCPTLGTASTEDLPGVRAIV